MNEQIMIGVVSVGVIIWVWLGVAEAIYNRCKRRAVEAENTNLLNALSKLTRSHEGWHHGIGPCQCEAHREARLVIRRHHERREL